jgi:hypothetical protein
MKTAVVRALGLFASVLVAGAASAQSTQAVEWKVSDGGNGHWYQVQQSKFHWSAARTSALSRGADLAALETPYELQWVLGWLPLSRDDYLIGGYQHASATATAEGWVWLNGTPVSGLPFESDDNPCGVFPSGVEDHQQDSLHLCCDNSRFGDINDSNFLGCVGGAARESIVEWSADCNSDGIVDYGQILRGELEDLNSNGVPDICETSIVSVLPPSVPAQGGSTITIRGNGFPANPTVLIGGVPATNVVRESLTRITATSPAVLPGMASVSVNDFTLADGIYIRPECGSDLDQDGEVTAADIAIVLLDFGPCYSNAANTQPQDSTPFLLQDQPAAVVPQAR